LVAFLIGLIGLILAVPPMLGWGKDRLLFTVGIVVFIGAIAFFFAPVQKPYSQVNCGSVVQPKYEWIGTPIDYGPDPLGNGRIGADYHEACAHNRSEALMQVGTLFLFGLGMMIVYGQRERRRRDPRGAE
jgi:Na+/melibiose symporter-like transporter